MVDGGGDDDGWLWIAVETVAEAWWKHWWTGMGCCECWYGQRWRCGLGYWVMFCFVFVFVSFDSLCVLVLKVINATNYVVTVLKRLHRHYTKKQKLKYYVGITGSDCVRLSLLRSFL